jgi:hypothetical protein
MKPGNHFREVRTTLYPTTGRIDEDRIIDTLVRSQRGSGLVIVPVFLETFGQYRSNVRFVLFTPELWCSGRSSTRLRIQGANCSDKDPYSAQPKHL